MKTIRGHPGAPEVTRVRWTYVWLAWAGVALVFSGQNVVGALASGVPVDWAWAVYHEVLYWAVWAALTPAVVAWARRYRLGEDGGGHPWAAHLALATVLAPLHIALAYALHAASLLLVGALPLPEVGAWLRERRVGFLVIALTGYWKYAAIVGVFYAFDYYRRWRDQRERSSALALRAARLEGQLARTKLSALRSRLRPHFLFNTLNSIAVLTRESPDEAEATIRRLSALLRQTLEHEEAEEVPLERELEFLERYLEIQRTRYEERLRVEVDCDPDAREVPVPFLLLQPLVENAIRHGLDGRDGSVHVTVRARKADGSLGIVVRDRPLRKGALRGRGDDASTTRGTGLGLGDLRERLAQLYGGDHACEAGPSPDGGFVVRLEIPTRPAPTGERPTGRQK